MVASGRKRLTVYLLAEGDNSLWNECRAGAVCTVCRKQYMKRSVL